MPRVRNPIPKILRGLFFAAWVGGLVYCERRRALRSVVASKTRRDVRNLVIAAAAAASLQLIELPLAFQLAKQAEDRSRGLLQLLPVPQAVRTLAAIALLDYTLYWWHILTHRLPLLWRFHQAHHIDREMDASTALRFHFGEMTLSAGYRAAQVLTIGPSPFAFAAWQTFLFACILFHHANIDLPIRWERRLAHFIVTPRLHGIHHSIAPEQVNSNWSSGLTIWDILHGTLRTQVPQGTIVIGVACHRGDRDQDLLNVLTRPFVHPAPIPPAPQQAPCQTVRALAE